MPKLFISYRREDSADATGRLHDRLKARFGGDSVMMDVDSIPLAVDFREYLSDAVSRCDVLLAMIGERWLDAAFVEGPRLGQRRLDDHQDFVRMEIAAAFARGIPVIPVLVGGARMPKETDLPESIRELAYRNAAEVRSGRDFHGHVDRLIEELDRLIDKKRELRDDLQKAIDLADRDRELALIRARRVLERIVRDTYERLYHEPPGTRSLENLLHRLIADGNFPDRRSASASQLAGYGQPGTHAASEAKQSVEVHRLLDDLAEILAWYCKDEPPAKNSPRPSEAASASADLAIVPKGLASFTAQDADFYLALLPGPRDKSGLPESVRFWKYRLEAKEEPAFAVGVIYGPSGCGKSSLVKAGLLPRLASHVAPLYVEATADDTENRLVRAIIKKCPELSGASELTELLSALRQGKGLQPGCKIVVILDQFEQWLQARQHEPNSKLAAALRQCDGARVQCVIMVRDDFWMALTRFMASLDIDLVQGQNIAAVDLFDLDHARKVLIAFGRAFGRLAGEPNKDNETFLDRALSELSQNHRIISVRLSLFAEMVKSKPWTSATWKAIGGIDGVGMTYLEEAFCSAIARPNDRRYQLAAQATLNALLPVQGSDIRGSMKSHDDLLQASGFAKGAKEFDDLLKLLSGELRLITPTEPDAEADSEPAPQNLSGKYFQLTHDYLVHSLRQWLNRKQGETPRGRAEKRLAECSSAWNARRVPRLLPSFWEFASIRQMTDRQRWSEAERRLMRATSRFYLLRSAIVAGLVLAVALSAGVIWYRVDRQKHLLVADGLVHQLLDADADRVPAILTDLDSYREWADPLLQQILVDEDSAQQHSTSEADRTEHAQRRLRASLALAPIDDKQVANLSEQLLDAGPHEVILIRDALDRHKVDLVDRLWAVAKRPPAGHESQRLRAACALAVYDPESARWSECSGPVVDQLLAVGPDLLAAWMEALRPVRGKMLHPLVAVFKDSNQDRTNSYIAASILADYAADSPEVLADLLLDSDEKQFVVLFPRLKLSREQLTEKMEAELAAPIDPAAPLDKRIHAARRLTNAGVALLKLDRPQPVWPMLIHRPDEGPRAYLIERIGRMGVKPSLLIDRLLTSGSDSSQTGQSAGLTGSPAERMFFDPAKSLERALLLSLGKFDRAQFSPADQNRILGHAVKLYQDDPDPGVHGAAEWLLRTWGQMERLTEIDRVLATGKIEDQRRWYVNRQFQTLAIVPGPSSVVMGSPPQEIGREGGPDGKTETQKRMTIDRSFAIATKELTVEQFLQFRPNHVYNKQFARTPDSPVSAVLWYQAAAYCNWLSEKEGIRADEWCYLPNSQGKYADGMKTAPDYLRRTGYRLPTEAEWELACRAGAVNSRYYGDDAELLGSYAWFTKNSLDQQLLPVGRLLPNDLGLFDTLGNLLEWTMHGVVSQSAIANETGGDDVEVPQDAVSINDSTSRISRGGSFLSYTLNVRAAFRNWTAPSFPSQVTGFRVARTMP